jgi:hypothetical protein
VIEVVVVGQVARDLVLLVDEQPAGGRAATVHKRREMLGGKGANQAVALAQLGVSVALVGVVGDDEEADRLLAQARADGIEVAPVIRRAGTRSGLIVDVVDDRRQWHHLEDLPDEILLTEEDMTPGRVRRRAGARRPARRAPGHRRRAPRRCPAKPSWSPAPPSPPRPTRCGPPGTCSAGTGSPGGPRSTRPPGWRPSLTPERLSAFAAEVARETRRLGAAVDGWPWGSNVTLLSLAGVNVTSLAL